MTREYNYSTKVMGCDFDMTFIANSTAQADRYFTQAVNIAHSYEKRFSRFDSESELSCMNKNKSVEVSREFLDVYWVAYHLYKKTHAQFNPLVQVSRIGYDRSFDMISDNSQLNSVVESEYNTNLDDVAILSHRLILQDSQKLDFGGFLKGYVVQKIAQIIDNEQGMIINIGGDMYVHGRDEQWQKFVVEISHPHDESKNISVPLMDKALCTSGTYKRKWKQSNKQKHHIVDAQSKDSTQTDVISASVVHKEGAVADAYATLAIIWGSQKAKKFFDSQQLDFVIICENDDILASDYFTQKV